MQKEKLINEIKLELNKIKYKIDDDYNPKNHYYRNNKNN